MPPRSVRPLRWRRLWLAVAWLLLTLVVYLSLTPYPPPSGPQGGDKLQHLAAYAALGFCFAALTTGRRRLAWMLGLVALGMLLEVVQALTGLRQGSWGDALANLLGVALGKGLAQTRLAEVFVWAEGLRRRGRGR